MLVIRGSGAHQTMKAIVHGAYFETGVTQESMEQYVVLYHSPFTVFV